MKKKLLIKLFCFLFSIPVFRKSFLLAGKYIAITGQGSNECLKEGFLPVRVHFYSPLPDIEDLKRRKIWGKKSLLPGIDFNKQEQIIFLKKLTPFGKECCWSLHPTRNSSDFFIDNQSFSFGCAAVVHSMIRKYKPHTVVEIGSGHSSKVISQALVLNKKPYTYTIVDPYPAPWVKNKKISFSKLLSKKVELVNVSFFDSLTENDILFIDSSHSVKIGSDVNFLFLEIFPRLNPGVIIHIHDINLPFDYPKTYAVNETFRQFWTEQYLLQAFLIFNKHFDILLAMSDIMENHIKEFAKVFPHYNPNVHKAFSGSFWMRRNKHL